MSTPISLESFDAVVDPSGGVCLVFTFSDGKSMKLLGTIETNEHIVSIVKVAIAEAKKFATPDGKGAGVLN